MKTKLNLTQKLGYEIIYKINYSKKYHIESTL